MKLYTRSLFVAGALSVTLVQMGGCTTILNTGGGPLADSTAATSATGSQSTYASPSSTQSPGASASPTPSATPAPTVKGYAIGSGTGVLSAAVGDALSLVVYQVMSDGSTSSLPAAAAVAWSGPSAVTAVSPDATGNAILATSSAPVAIFIKNPSRPDHTADLPGALFVLDAGTQANPTVAVTAAISGVTPSGNATASVGIKALPAGDAGRGANLWANCAACHGQTGHGSVAGSDGKYMLPGNGGNKFDYPAPGLNAEAGNVAADPAWNAPLLAMASRGSMDNLGVALRKPMPDWLSTPLMTTGQLATAQDFADIYAYLKGQAH